MPNLKLTYFDFHGGRGEPARLAMFVAGIAFEDDRLSFDAFRESKASFPFGAIPVLEVDGQTVAQSNGINRFVGKLAGLYPEDPWQAALCDEAMDAVEDISHRITTTFSIKDEEEKRAARQALVDGPLRFYLSRLNVLLENRGGEFFSDTRLIMADLKVFVFVRYLKSGILDHVPGDLTDQVAPLLVDHFQRVNKHPKIKAYYGNAD